MINFIPDHDAKVEIYVCGTCEKEFQVRSFDDFFADFTICRKCEWAYCSDTCFDNHPCMVTRLDKAKKDFDSAMADAKKAVSDALNQGI